MLLKISDWPKVIEAWQTLLKIYPAEQRRNTLIAAMNQAIYMVKTLRNAERGRYPRRAFSR